MAPLLKPFGNLLNPKRTVPTGALRIDWTHPLANGLVGCWLPGVAGNNDLTGIHAPFPTATGTPNWTPGPEGPGFYNNTAYIGGSASPSKVLGATQWTLYSRGYQTSTNGSGGHYNPLIVSYDSNYFDDPFFFIGLDGFGGSGANFGAQWNTTGFASGYRPSTIPNAGQVASLGATFVANGNVTVYRDGLNAGSSSFSGGAPTSTATSAVYVGSQPGKGEYTNSTIYCSYFWTRALNDAEMALLDREPYCFLIPYEGEMPALYLAAGGETVTVDKWFQPLSYQQRRTEMVGY